MTEPRAAAKRSQRLTAEAILAADDVEEREVFVDPWNGTVLIRALTSRQMAEIRRECSVRDRFGQLTMNWEKAESRLFIESMVDPPLDRAAFEKLRNKSARAIAVVLTAIVEISGLGETDFNHRQNGNGHAPKARRRRA